MKIGSFKTDLSTIAACITALFILFIGKPDLHDAIIRFLMEYGK